MYICNRQLCRGKIRGERKIMRKYEIRQSDAEGAPIIDEGESPFYTNDIDLVPDGFDLDVVINSPGLKKIFVIKE